MNNKKLYSVLASIALLSTFSATPLLADDTMQLSGDTSHLEQVSFTFDGTNYNNDLAGGIVGSINSGPSQFFFCYDLTHNITLSNSYDISVVSAGASGLNPALNLAPSFNRLVASSLLNNSGLASFTNTDQYAGLQMAIWSILYNWTSVSHPTNTLAGSAFSAPGISSAINNYALGDLTIAANYINSQSPGNWNLLVVNPQGDNQTLVGVTVPEPATYVLLGSLLGLAFLMYGRKKSNLVQKV